MQYLKIIISKPYWVLLITMVLTMPALFSGWLGDDYIHYALLNPDLNLPKPNDWSLFGLFSWLDAEPERTRTLMDMGVIPWWTYEGFKYQFWRPLAELSHWLDYRLWPDQAMMMHVQSLLWYLGLGALLYRLYCKVGMPPLAVIAALALFLWDSSHGMTLAWIANRNALMASLFGTLSLLCYLDWRNQAGTKTLLLSLFWLVCSLFSGEIGISTCAYIGSYALTVDKAGPVRALKALWPYVVVSIVWWVAYKLGNFGANHSDTNYIDPLESPVIFAGKLLERVPVLLFAQFGLVPADVFGFQPQYMFWSALISVAFLALLILVLLPLLKASAVARFWALGCVLSAFPISSTIPSDRNLLMVGIGASALIGLLLESVSTTLSTSRLTRIGASILLVMHLVISPLLMPLMSYSPRIWNKLMALDLNQKMPVQSNHERVLLFGLSMPIALATTPMRFAHGTTLPERLWLISSDMMNFTIKRTATGAIEIESDQGMISDFEQSLRDLSREPLHVGQVVATDSIRIHVTKLDPAGHPLRLTAEFNDRISDTLIIFWNGKSFERAPLPELGETLELNLRH